MIIAINDVQKWGLQNTLVDPCCSPFSYCRIETGKLHFASVEPYGLSNQKQYVIG